jgi:signal transduction histidine kinase
MEKPVTEREEGLGNLERKIERQMEEIKRLEDTVELRGHFIYHIANDLKTPLTSIMGFSKLLYSREYGKLNADQQRHISNIVEETSRLMGMVDQIRDAVHLDSNRVKLELTEVNIAEMYEDPAIRMLEEMAKNKGLEFSWSTTIYDKPLFNPKTGQIELAADKNDNIAFNTPITMADHDMILQVFVNLIGNAIKFTDKGSVEVRIRNIVRHDKGGKPNYVECSVLDTGIGVSEEGRHRLFRAFYPQELSGSSTRRERSGIGLGLSLSKEIVALHGGKIGYEPREDGGSRFWFIIPIRRKVQKPAN